ncbi:MAG TPA: hypothetical protein VGB79_16340 [Allosphingosinicella sp.]|jgi:hypothetical protein
MIDRKHDIDANDMVPPLQDLPAQDAMEQAQKDAAEERETEGGYGG